MNDPLNSVQMPYHKPDVPLDDILKPDETRMAAHRIIGQATSGSKIGDVVSGSPASTNLGTGTALTSTIADATSGTFNFTVTDNFSRVLLAVPDMAVYIGTPSAATLWPNTSFGMGNMPIAFFNNWGLTNNVNVVHTIVVRNNTGSPQTVTVIGRFRIITNSTPALSGLDTGASSQ